MYIYIHTTALVNFKNITLNESSQIERLCTEWFHLYEILEKANYSDGKQMNDCLESGVEGDQEQKGTRNILQVRELLNTLFKVMLTQFYLLNKSHWTVLWKQFFFFWKQNFVVCNYFHNKQKEDKITHTRIWRYLGMLH